ncbi:DUF6292 family protein [Sinosporangium siamense]|uniref:DUF6292 domain-containing protein n=1 Tax=Sinosporangium siamense TaxID=1367973 RepID=A0A919V790_9ACTN|nr:DUF6292 family protein [Sinosporangium siamense]GII93228.1 hypothetical protein Ssi02_34590 [Sinosporangium siamense]
MVAVRYVEPYTDEWLTQPAFYLLQVVETLGVDVVDWWAGPFDPREATLRMVDGNALVWDEESGWRLGRLIAGERGLRSVLTDVRYLGGGLLPRPDRVPEALADARRGIGGSTAFRPCYRSYRHRRDGFDMALSEYVLSSAGAMAPVRM